MILPPPYMEKVRERLSILKMMEAERMECYRYGKEVAYSQDVLLSPEEKGRKEAQAQIHKAKTKIEQAEAKIEHAERDSRIAAARNLLKLEIKLYRQQGYLFRIN